MDQKPFSPRGKTSLIAAAASAPLGIQVVEEGTTGGIQVRVHNSSTTVTAFLSYGSTDTAAQSNAVIPTAGSPQNGFPLPPSIVEVLSLPANCFVSAITASGTASIYITRGAGI